MNGEVNVWVDSSYNNYRVVINSILFPSTIILIISFYYIIFQSYNISIDSLVGLICIVILCILIYFTYLAIMLLIRTRIQYKMTKNHITKTFRISDNKLSGIVRNIIAEKYGSKGTETGPNRYPDYYLPQSVIPIHDSSRLYLWRHSDKILYDRQFF